MIPPLIIYRENQWSLYQPRCFPLSRKKWILYSRTSRTVSPSPIVIVNPPSSWAHSKCAHILICDLWYPILLVISMGFRKACSEWQGPGGYNTKGPIITSLPVETWGRWFFILMRTRECFRRQPARCQIGLPSMFSQISAMKVFLRWSRDDTEKGADPWA